MGTSQSRGSSKEDLGKGNEMSEETPLEIKEGDTIYYRRAGNDGCALSKSTVQKIHGNIIDVNDGRWTNYPGHLDLSRIEIVQIEKE